MGNFNDRLTLTIDVLTGKSATSPFKSIRDDIDATDGVWGKAKAGASGVFDFISQNAAGFALGAGAAIGGFAVKAVGDFQDIGIEAGNLRDSLGLSAEDASRWIEVADDLGIGADKIETSMGKMLRTAGSSPGVFKDLGVQIAYAKDGSVDANGTFLNVIDRLNSMKDPAERAATAQKLLGRSWMDSAELIGLGAEGVKARLDDVSDARVVSDAQIDQARDLRDQMDNLSDTAGDLALSLGSTLLPIVANIAEGLAEIAGPVVKLIDVGKEASDKGEESGASFWDGFVGGLARSVPLVSGHSFLDAFSVGAEDVNASVGQLPTTLDAAKVAAAGIELQADATGTAVERMRGMFGLVIPTAQEMAAAQDAVAQATKDSADRQKHLDETMAGVNAKVQEQIDRLSALHEESVNAADATLALNDAQADFIDKVGASNELLKDGKGGTEEFTDAVNGERDAMIDVAKKTEEANQKRAEAAGVTYTAQQRVDDFNASLLNNAHFATPAARDAITDYIIEANGVPKEKATDIRAAIAAGDFETANRLLNEASRTRTAAINADAQTAQAERDLNNTARNRTAQIQANFTGGPQQARAKGGPVKKGVPYLVGEQGPEPFVPDQDGTIIPTGQAFGAGSPLGVGRGLAAGPVFNITVHAGMGTDGMRVGNQVIAAIKQWERANGPAWRK